MRKIKIVQVIVIGDKAYVPSKGVYPSGLFTSIEPVWIGKSTMDELLPVVPKMVILILPLIRKEIFDVQ